MPDTERESIQKLQAAIRKTRGDLGLPKEGPLRQQQFLDALRKKPPIDKLVGFVRKSLADDSPISTSSRQERSEPPPFDKRA